MTVSSAGAPTYWPAFSTRAPGNSSRSTPGHALTSHHFDIVIIGGGVIGASAANSLAVAGASVAVLESGAGPSGASVACDGFVFLQSKAPGPSLELAKASRKLYDTLADELGRDIEFEPRGGLVVARSDAELAALHERARVLADAGVPVERLSPAETLGLEPHLTRRLAGATYCPWDAQVSPLALVNAYWSNACRHGARLFADSPVTAIARSAGGFEVQCRGRVVHADRVVIAAGACSRDVGAMLGIDVPVRPRRGQLVVTEAAPPMLSRPVMTADYLRAKVQAGAAQSAAGTSLEQTRPGTILVGSTREFAGFDASTTPEGIQSILSRAVGVLPGLRELSVIRSYAGLRPYCELGRPIVGPAPGHPGVYIATGHEGDGIALAPITGKLVAQCVLGKTPEAEGRWLGLQPVA